MNNFIWSLSAIFSWILKTSLMASVLVGLILMVKFVLKDKLNIKWQYMIWFILILRLILPWAPESSFSLFNLLSFTEKLISAPTISGIVQNDSTTPNFTVTGTVTEENNQIPHGNQAAVSNGTVAVGKEVSWFDVSLTLIWILGIITLAMYLILLNRKFSRKIKKGYYVRFEDILIVLEQCKGALHIKRNIPLVVTNGVEGPTLYGWLRPKILLPAKVMQDFTLHELRYIFIHELIHLKRKDIFVNWLTAILLILHWFNPVLWYAYKRMREDQELSCDAAAVSNIRSDEVNGYGLTLIKMLERYSQTSQFQTVANFSANKSQLKRRITMITLFKNNSYKWSVFGLVILLIITGLALTNAKSPQKGVEVVKTSMHMEDPVYQGDKKTKLIVENKGPTKLSFGMSYSLEMLKDGKWTPIQPKESIVTMEGVLLKSGGTWEQEVQLEDLVPGHYRFVKEVQEENTDIKRNLFAEFNVIK